MRIESLARLIDAELLNTPSITYIDQLKIEPKQVKRADAFICIDEKDIKNAIQNGAYAIISEKKLQITDNEIAWMVVDDIKKALIRYLRYKTIQNRANFFLSDSITFEILNCISPKQRVILLDDDIFKSFLQIVNADEDMIFVSKDKKLLGGIFPAYLSIEESKKEYVRVIKNSLFTIDFIYKDEFYKDIHLPLLFTLYLNKAIKFLEKYYIEIAFEKLWIKRHFSPIFIDNYSNIKEFGQTSKVIIEEIDETYIQNEVNFLNTYAKYAKKVVILPKNFEINLKNIKVFRYSESKEFVELFKEDYNFFLILNKEKKDIFTILKETKQNYQQRSLF